MYSSFYFRFCIILLPAFLSSVLSEPLNQRCGAKFVADIVFALDTSASIDIDQFNRQLSLVENVMQSFLRPANDIRVGLLTYSYHVYPVFDLSSFSTDSAIHRAVQQAHYGQEGTHTDKAIAYASDVILSAQHSGRRSVPKILILITDGTSDNIMRTKIQAKHAKAKGINIIVVGIGNFVDRRELEMIANSPTSKFLLNIDSFAELKKIIRVLSNRKCKVSKKRTSSLKKEEIDSYEKMQITFVYDEQSLTEGTTRILRKSLISMVKQFDTRRQKIEFVRLTHVPRVRARSKRYFLKDLKRDQIQYLRLSKLLKESVKMIESVSKNRRHLMVVFLPGKRLRSRKIHHQLARLSEKAYMYVVKLTPYVHSQQEDDKLCNANRTCIYTVDNTIQVHEILDNIKFEICKGKC